jgi:hypothetical protein
VQTIACQATGKASVRLGTNVSAAAEITATDINTTDGHTHVLTCDILKVADMTVTNINTPSMSRLISP